VIQVWSFKNVTSTPTAGHSLNKGSTKPNDPAKGDLWYTGPGRVTYPHRVGSVDRRWGPSSRHPGVVQHAYGDAHAGALNEAINDDVYLHLITRNGRETIKETN
jgi:hypothetical protein